MQIIEKDISWLLERVPDFNKFFADHKDMFQGGYLAGGFARAMILKGSAERAMRDIQNHGAIIANDVDFFYVSLVDCNRAVRKLTKLTYEKANISRFSLNRSVTGYAQDFYDRKLGIKYQLIIKNTGTPFDVLSRFDISNCKIATNGQKVWMVEDWEELENNKLIRVDNYAGGMLLNRVKKYLFRNNGYTLWQGNRDELFVKLIEKAREQPQVVRGLLNVMKNCFQKENILIFHDMLGQIDVTEKDGQYEQGSLNAQEDFAVHMYKRMLEKEAEI